MIVNVPYISVIVPVYNVSKYLEKCLNSIVNQTLENIEIIIINDCSPDPKDDLICQRYAIKDRRIKYIKHSKNLGIGGARNTGITKSKAKFIAFVDSDDFIEKDLYRACYEEAIKNERDVVIFNIEHIDENLNNLSTITFNGDTTGDLVNNFLENKKTVTPGVCNKMWKKSLFTDNNIEFPINTYSEDTIVTLKLLYFVKNITSIDNIYFYIKHEGSLTNSASTKHIDDIFFAFSEISHFLRSVGKLDDYIEPLRARIWGMIRYFISTGLESCDFDQKKEILSYLADKVILEGLGDTNYYFPHRVFIKDYSSDVSAQ